MILKGVLRDKLSIYISVNINHIYLLHCSPDTDGDYADLSCGKTSNYPSA